VEQALKKCPNGMYAEIKYDGERLQLHKQGDSFQYYSRSLKAVLPHKVGGGREGDSFQYYSRSLKAVLPHKVRGEGGEGKEGDSFQFYSCSLN